MLTAARHVPQLARTYSTDNSAYTRVNIVHLPNHECLHTHTHIITVTWPVVHHMGLGPVTCCFLAAAGSDQDTAQVVHMYPHLLAGAAAH